MTNETRLSAETVKAIRDAVWTVKEGQEKFVKVYEMCLTDFGGTDWRKTYKKWPNFDEVVGELETQLKAVCIEAGMTLTVFNKYRTAARKYHFFGVPFKFGANFSIGEIREAQELARAMTTGTDEQKVREAFKAVRAKKNLASAKGIIGKKGTVLMWPEEGSDIDAYFTETIDRVLGHFETAEVSAHLDEKKRKLLKLIRRKVDELAVVVA